MDDREEEEVYESDDEEYEYSDREDEDEEYDDDAQMEEGNADPADVEFADAGNGQDASDSKPPSKSSSKPSAQKKSMKMLRKSDNNPNAAPVGGSSFMEDDMGVMVGKEKIGMVKASDIAPVMKRRLREVIEVLDVPPSAAAVLMREYRWAKEALFESFYNDPEKVQKKCGVFNRCQRKAGKAPPGKRRLECLICCEDGFAAADMLSMPCGHEFCRDCWKGFVDCALAEGPSCVRTSCPQAGCNEVMTEDEVEIAAPELLPKFESFQLRSFVEMNSVTRWCPGPGCERIALCKGSPGGLYGDIMGVVANCGDCGTCFCLRCGEEPHAPISCRELAKWNEKCRNESETANWILANTKACPKCASRIEKNQGCNHMSCQQCKHEFCWICMGPWSEHGPNTGGYYSCNKYDDSDNSDQSDAARAKRELDRYLHYYKRFHAHAEAQKFAKKQLRETEVRMVLLQESSDNSTWTDVEFLKTANEQLVECRRVLKYTYAFAYYMSEDKSKAMQKQRFENHQEMLERFTENLSELSEKPLAEMDRTDVVNQTRVVDRFMKNILKYVEDGMES